MDVKIIQKTDSQKSRWALSSSHSIKNKHDVCRGKDDMEKLIESLREHIMKVINLKKK